MPERSNLRAQFLGSSLGGGGPALKLPNNVLGCGLRPRRGDKPSEQNAQGQP